MTRRRLKHKQSKSQRRTPLVRPKPVAADPAALFSATERFEANVVARETPRAERIAYTRTQAAAALGISRTTFNRHVLPFLDTIEIGSGTRLIPTDELHRYTNERRKPPTKAEGDRARHGRPATLPHQLVKEMRAAHADGRSLAQIARDLNAAGIPTAHGGARWWPSTVRAVLDRLTT